MSSQISSNTNYIRFISAVWMTFTIVSAPSVDLTAEGCATYYAICGNITRPSICTCKYTRGNTERGTSCSSLCLLKHAFSLVSILESVPESIELSIICSSAAQSEVVLKPTMFRQYGSNIRSFTMLSCNVIGIIEGLASALTHMDTLQLLNGNIDDNIHPALREVSNISFLCLNNNKLTTLPAYTFCAENSRCILKILNVGANRLHFISKRAFNGLVFLERLVIANNDLHIIYVDTWLDSLSSLNVLKAENNSIRQFVNSASTSSLTLKNLNLSYNNITEWTCTLKFPKLINLTISYNSIPIFDEKCFQMTALENLDVRYNKLANIPGDDGFVHLTSNLTVLFEGNPLFCTFTLYFCEKNRFLKRNEEGYLNEHIVIGDYNRLNCFGPTEFLNKTFSSIPAEDIHCSIPNDCLSCPYYKRVSDDLRVYNCSYRSWENDLPMKTDILEMIESLKLSNVSIIPSRFAVSDNVNELYLNNNDITAICHDSFEGLPNLRKLALNENDITRINNEFVDLMLVEELFLNDNSIKQMDSASFSTNANLTHLYLHNNQLETLPKGIFDPVTRLKLISLHNNKFKCECNLLWLKLWINDNIKIVLRASDILCVDAYNGNMTDIPILQLLDVYFNCNGSDAKQLGTISAIILSVITVIVFFVTLLLVIHRKYIRWLLYVRYGDRLFNENDNEGQDIKKYDAFISYSSLDYQVVLYDLAPVLEGRDPPYQLCLHYRDFPVGASIADTIIETVAASRRTILLLSPNFLVSEWCLLEFKVAYEQVMQDRMNRLIVVLLEDICEDKLDKNLKKYLSTNNYIHWNDPLFWEKLYKLLPDDDMRLNRLKGNKGDGNHADFNMGAL